MEGECLMGKSRSLKLSFKLVLGIVVFSVLGLGVAFVIVNTMVRDTIYGNIIGISQRDKTIYAEQIDAWMGMSHRIVDNLSSALLSMGIDQIDALEAGLLEEYDFLDGAYMGFSDGSFAGFGGWDPGPTWDSTTRAWYRNAINAGVNTTITSTPYVSAATDGLVAAVSRHIGRVDGRDVVVAIDIHLTDINEKVESFEVAGGGYLFLVDAYGEILIHPDPQFLPTTSGLQNISTVPDYANAFARFRAGEELVLHRTQGGSFYLMQFPLNTIGWTLVAVIPQAVANDAVWEVLIVVMLTVALVLVVMALFIFFFISRSFLKPLKNLTKDAVQVAKGNVAINFTASKDDEIGQISNAFMEVVNSFNILTENFMQAEKEHKYGNVLYKLKDDRLKGTFAEILERTNSVAHEFLLYFDNLTLPFIVLDKNCKVLYANPVSMDYTHTKDQSVIGRHINEFLNGDVSNHPYTVKAFRDKTPQLGAEIQLQLNPKQLFDLEYSCVPLP
jgi:methyl-accepting chemotaxis protein